MDEEIIYPNKKQLFEREFPRDFSFYEKKWDTFEEESLISLIGLNDQIVFLSLEDFF